MRLFLRSFAAILLVVSLTTTVYADEHVLNFKDADIGALISTISDITGRNFIVDPQVTGRVTVISNQPLSSEEIYEVFLSVLRVHGYSALDDGRVTRIVPDTTARQDGLVPVDGMQRGGDEAVTRILQLRYVAANEAAQLLRPLLPQSAFIVAHESSNTLLISDRVGNVQRVETIVRRLDTASDHELDVMALNHANASEVVGILNRLDPQNENAIADERTNTIILSGDPGKRLRLRTLISHLDTPLESDGATQVVYLNYADAEGLVSVLESILDESSGEERQAATRIRAHPETNALVVTAPPAVFRNIRSVISQLDIRRAQVQVEAIIAEVAVDTSRDLGIQWQFFSDGDSGVFGGTNFQNGGRNILNLSAALGAEEGDLVLPGRGLNVGYVGGRTSLLGVDLLEIGALLRALSTSANTNVLSTPSVVTLDNHEATINVGQEVPFLTGSFATEGVTTSEGRVNPFQTINREEIGIKLNVTPHINESGTIRMDIFQEVSTLAPSSGAVDLITNKRTVTTSVMVPDGAILVLGGLITDDLLEGTERVPGLSRIPLLGELFKYRTSSHVKRNLMVFIRPQILHDEEIMHDLTRSKYSFLRERQLEQRDQPRGMTPAEEMPLLPELYEFLQAPPKNE